MESEFMLAPEQYGQNMLREDVPISVEGRWLLQSEILRSFQLAGKLLL